jgi:hypothetical protein
MICSWDDVHQRQRPDGRQRRQEYDGSDKTAGRGVRQRPPRSAQILDRQKRWLNSFRKTFEPLEIERTPRKELWEGGPTAARHHLDAREKHYQAGDRGDAGHDHEQAEQKPERPFVQMT